MITSGQLPARARRDVRMKRFKKAIGFGALLLMTITIQSCMTGMQLYTTSADQKLISGTYNLLLYGCHYPAQVENVAILVDENSKYPLEIYDIDTSFKVKKGVPAQQALTEADAFVRCSSHIVWQTQITRIPDDSGGTVGYEVRPLYAITEFGTPDILLISYSLKDGKVRAYIKKSTYVEDQGGDSRDHDSDGDH
jgi:hypothetical protein